MHGAFAIFIHLLTCTFLLCVRQYEMLLSQGTDLVDGIMRSSPLYNAAGGTQASELFDAAERINITQVSVTVLRG